MSLNTIKLKNSLSLSSSYNCPYPKQQCMGQANILVLNLKRSFSAKPSYSFHNNSITELNLYHKTTNIGIDNKQLVYNNINSEHHYDILYNSELIHSIKPFNLNLDTMGYYLLTPTNIPCFSNISNINNYISNINYSHFKFSSLNFYYNPGMDYYTFFNFFFSHRFIFLPVILLILYNLNSFIINCSPGRTDNSNTVDTWESQSPSSQTRESNSTVSNSVGNPAQGSSTLTSGGAGDGDEDGDGHNDRDVFDHDSIVRDDIRYQFEELSSRLNELASNLNAEILSASADVERELANIPANPDAQWFRSHGLYNPNQDQLIYNTPRTFLDVNNDFTIVLEFGFHLENMVDSRYLNST